MPHDSARVGRRAPENVYWQDQPVITLPVEQAEELVAALNALPIQTANALVVRIRAEVSLLGDQFIREAAGLKGSFVLRTLSDDEAAARAAALADARRREREAELVMFGPSKKPGASNV